MNLFKFNLIIIGIPIFFFLIGIWDHGFWIWTLLSGILTGLTHIIIGFGMRFDHPKDKHIKRYCGLVISFFACWFLSVKLDYSSYFLYCLISIPPVLAFYLTYIIYKNRNS